MERPKMSSAQQAYEARLLSGESQPDSPDSVVPGKKLGGSEWMPSWAKGMARQVVNIEVNPRKPREDMYPSENHD